MVLCLALGGCNPENASQGSKATVGATTQAEGPELDKNSPLWESTTEVSKAEPTTKPDPSVGDPKSLLESCIANYQQLKSYEDEAEIHLNIPYPTNPIQDKSKERIAFERPNKLAIQTSQVQSIWSASTLESIAGNQDFKPFENQRVVRSLPEKITLNWLLEDHLFPVLNRPAIGVPLSIELLFSGEPLKYLLNDASFQWLEPEHFDSVLCKRIEAIYQGQKYCYWIDANRKLVLRQDFPFALVQGLFPPIPEGMDQSGIQLSVNFFGARINHAVDWSKWQLPSREGDVLVRRFADPPPRNLPKELGESIKPVLLRGPNGEEVFDSAERKSLITLFFWIDDSDASRSFVDEVYKVQKSLEKSGLNGIAQLFLVTSKPADRMAVVMKAWNCSLPIAIDATGELTQQFGRISTFSSAILGKDGRIQSIESVPQLDLVTQKVDELKRDVDLASRFKKSALDDEAKYASRLHRNILDRSQIEKMSPQHREIATFPFTFHDMTRDWAVGFEDSIVAASGELYWPRSASDAIPSTEVYADKKNLFRVMTVMDNVGNIISIDQTGKRTAVATIPIEQLVEPKPKRIHILADPWTHRWIAVLPEGLPRFWFFVAPSTGIEPWTPTDAIQIPIDAGESVVGGQWAMQEGSPVLCVFTDAPKLYLLNPATQKWTTLKPRASVKNASIVAVVPSLNSNAETEGWNTLWSDRSVDPIDSLSSKNANNSQLATLPFVPDVGNWVWGKGKQETMLIGLEKRPETGETGAVYISRDYVIRFQQALSVRPEQSKLLSAVTNKKGFYWLGTAPRQVVHLQTVDGSFADQMSFGRRVYGGTLLPAEDQLKMIIALDNQVSSWTLTPNNGP